jgi:hypothetical protein
MRNIGLRIGCALLTFTFGIVAAKFSSSVVIAPPQLNTAMVVLSPAVDSGQLQPRLPSEVKQLLDRTFPGWQFPMVRREVRGYLKEDLSNVARSEVITSDFDGDGQIDYAVILDYWMAATSQTPPIGSDKSHYFLVVAFLKRNGYEFLKREVGYEMYQVGIGGEYLSLMKKGSRAYDFAQRQYFDYPDNAIFVGYYGKGGTSYVYTDGSFRAILTSCPECPAPVSF